MNGSEAVGQGRIRPADRTSWHHPREATPVRPFLGVLCLAAALSSASAPRSARAQWAGNFYSGADSAYGAPGFYGMSYGVASFGVPRTYSAYSSSYGAGYYAYGHQPVGSMPGKFGVEMWRPGFTAPGYVYGGATSYRTFPVATWPVPSGYGPPVGTYAPGFGPSPLPD